MLEWSELRLSVFLADGVPLQLSQQHLQFHISMTVSCVLILVQLNKCDVVCDSVLQRGHNGEVFPLCEIR